MSISLPFPLFPLICASIATATFTLALAAFTVGVSLALWIIPAAFIVTLALHAVFLLVSNSEDAQAGSLRVFSIITVIASYFVAILWTVVLVVTSTITAKLFLGRLKSAPNNRSWALVTASVASLIEATLTVIIAVQTHKVRRNLRYREKWRWRPALTTPQWSIATRVGRTDFHS